MGTTTLETATDPDLAAPKEPLSKLGQLTFNCVSVLSAYATFLVLRRQLEWETAAGLLGVVIAHELGHLAVARCQGVPSTWPVFIPNVGAFVLTLRPFKDPSEEAYVALGGPVAGLAATAILHAIGVWTDSPPLLGITVFCYAIHLINMIPAGILDGGKIAELVCKPLCVPGFLGLLWVVYEFSSGNWWEILVALLALWPAAQKTLTVLNQWRQKNTSAPFTPCRSDLHCVAGLSIGVVLFALVGLCTARYQRGEVIFSHWLGALRSGPETSDLLPAYIQVDSATGENPTPPDGL
jgi:Zn-dependent protease